MTAVLLVGHGGYDKLKVRHDTLVGEPGAGEVLIRVTAVGMKNTDINTRVGWYSKSANGEANAGGVDGCETLDRSAARRPNRISVRWRYW